MDRTKFQIDILKDMLSTRPMMRRIDISDSEVGLTDGCHIVVFQKNSLKIRWEDLPAVSFDTSKASTNLPELFDSKVRKKVGGRILAKLWSKDKTVYSLVNEQFLNKFCGGSFFSNGGTSEVFVFDGIGTLSGIIMPIRGDEF